MMREEQLPSDMCCMFLVDILEFLVDILGWIVDIPQIVVVHNLASNWVVVLVRSHDRNWDRWNRKEVEGLVVVEDHELLQQESQLDEIPKKIHLNIDGTFDVFRAPYQK